jgi:hypothetical protein
VIDAAESGVIPDQNGDGYAELILAGILGNKKTYTILSGYDGADIARLEGENLMLEETGADFNINGSKDLIVYHRGKQLQVVDGNDGGVLWTYLDMGGTQRMPGRWRHPFSIMMT